MAFSLASLITLAAGCPSSAPTAAKVVTVYCAADREFAEGLFSAFEKETGVHVDAKYDTESAKTTGLGQEIAAERDRPRCDVFWDNELVQVLLLAGQGALAPLSSATLARSPVHGNRWIGFAARARVLLVNTSVVPKDARPRSVRDLADPRWKGRTGIANPLFGTTQDHVAALFAKLGADEGRALLKAFKENEVAVCAGNADVQKRVSSGELAFGFCDTDDAYEALSDKKPVEIVFPDQDGIGTLVLPNALAIPTGAPHEENALRLIEWLASEKGETPLAQGPGQHLPLLGGPAPAIFPKDLKAMSVDWDEVERQGPPSREAVEKILLGSGGGGGGG
jgi:iron(III) transport system substrate-binding protein